LLQFPQKKWKYQNETMRTTRKLSNCVFLAATWTSNFRKWYLQSFHDDATHLVISVTGSVRKFMMENMLLRSYFIIRYSYPCNRLWRPIGLWDVEAPTFSLDNWFTDGGKVVSLTHRPPFTTQEDSWYSFLLVIESTPGPWCSWKD
jgi:hypothetical protein